MQVSDLPPVVGKWHLLAYNLTASGTAGYQALQAANDPVFTQKSTNYQNPYNLGCFAAYLASTNMIRGRLNTASLRLRGFPQIRPFVNAAIPPDNSAFMDMFDHPIYLRPDEDIEVDADPGANADVIQAFLWVVGSADMYPVINGNVNAKDLRWVRYSATITNIQNAWSGPNAITLEDTIEGGSYDVYGAECFGTGNQAFRLWFQNQYFKPGTIAVATAAKRLPYPMYEQRFGFWGNFNTYSLPQLEIFNSAAAGAVAITGHLLIAKSSQVFRGQNM